jgi:hypothetical protein
LIGRERKNLYNFIFQIPEKINLFKTRSQSY